MPAKVERPELAPLVTDRRVVRLGKLAALALLSRGEAVTRATLVREARLVDAGSTHKKCGISERSLDTNTELRAVYEASRKYRPRPKRRRAGAIAAHIMRMNVWEICQALILGRLAVREREQSLGLLVKRLGRPFDMAELERLREQRRGLLANQEPNAASAASPSRRKAAEASRKAVTKEIGKPRSLHDLSSIDDIAKGAKLHPSTVARVLREMREETAASKLGRKPTLPPSWLLRLPKRQLARALHIERAYIRMIAHLYDDISDILIAETLNIIQGQTGCEGGLAPN